jgi:hypothetical protein
MTIDSDERGMRDLILVAVPKPETEPYKDWDEVLRRASALPSDGRTADPAASVPAGARAGRDFRRVARRRWIVAALAAVLLVLGGVALAAVADLPWWESAPPPVNPRVVDWQLAPPADGSAFPPTADRSRARTVAEEDGAALVAAPVGQTGYCIIPSLPGSPNIGFSCTYRVTDPKTGDGDEFRSYARPASAGAPRWIVYGRITDPAAAALDLSEAVGASLEVPLRPGGFFLANVPESRWDALDESAGRARILDASGATLRTGCVQWGPSPRSARAGLTRYPFWREGAGPCRREPPLPSPAAMDVSRAEKLVQLTLTSDFATWEKGTAIAVWLAPQERGVVCVFQALASLRPTGHDGANPPGAGSCGRGGRPIPPGQAVTVGFSASREPDGSYAWLIHGIVDPSLGISQLELRSRSASIPVAFGRGHFLAQLGRSNSADRLPAGGPHVLIGRDTAGNEVARENLDELHAAHRPR